LVSQLLFATPLCAPIGKPDLIKKKHILYSIWANKFEIKISNYFFSFLLLNKTALSSY
jgi:hypothetical protein